MALYRPIPEAASSDPRLGYYYQRDNNNIDFTKTAISNGVELAAAGSWGGVAFIEHDGTVALTSSHSGGGYGLIRTDGSSDGNLKTSTSVHTGDIILLASTTKVTITW